MSTARVAHSHSRSNPNRSMMGRKMGIQIMTIPVQSRKQPMMKTIRKKIASAPHLPRPMLSTNAMIRSSPSSDMKMPVKAAAPNRMINTMAVVFAVSTRES